MEQAWYVTNKNVVLEPFLGFFFLTISTSSLLGTQVCHPVKFGSFHSSCTNQVIYEIHSKIVFLAFDLT